tara:strand:+ start:132 stop:329 length:198 start_codon:yes stop_codon:yes gene_type:complete
MSDRALASIRASIKVLNDDYAELSRSYHLLRTSVAELQTEISWIKKLLMPIALASVASIIKMMQG